MTGLKKRGPTRKFNGTSRLTREQEGALRGARARCESARKLAEQLGVSEVQLSKLEYGGLARADVVRRVVEGLQKLGAA